MPGRSLAPSTARAAKPTPPAAPAPGSAERSAPVSAGHQLGPAGQPGLEQGDVAGSAPFCGP